MKKILLFFGVVVVMAMGFVFYLGGFAEVVVEAVEIPVINLVYAKHVGAYQWLGPAMDDISEKLNELGIVPLAGAGIYLDDSTLTETESLRSLVGSVVSDDDLEIFGDEFDVIKIKNAKGVMVDFPFKNGLSLILAPMKVYPVISAYLGDQGIIPSASLEIYDMEQGKIMIYMEIDDSYAAEAEDIFSEE